LSLSERNQLRLHRATTCPDGHVVCPFAAFGCAAKDLKRCTYDKHQSEAAQRHSELVAIKMVALEATISKLSSVYMAKIATLEATVAKQDTDYGAKIATLEATVAQQDLEHRAKAAALESNQSTYKLGMKSDMDTDCAKCHVALTISNVSEKKKCDMIFYSEPFDLMLDSGPVSLKLAAKLHGDKLGFYICHDKSRNAATARFPIALEGSTLALTHPNGLLQDLKKEFKTEISEFRAGLGFSVLPSKVESYIVDDKLHLKATVCVRKWGSFELAEI
jgi:hypothetical protein